jgi:hypothetical protein
LEREEQLAPENNSGSPSIFSTITSAGGGGGGAKLCFYSRSCRRIRRRTAGGFPGTPSPRAGGQVIHHQLVLHKEIVVEIVRHQIMQMQVEVERQQQALIIQVVLMEQREERVLLIVFQVVQ